MEQFHPKYPQIGNQQTSEHSATYFHPNQLNAAAINTGHYMPSQASGSLPPSTVSQQIPSSSQQHSSLGPSRLPFQGLFSDLAGKVFLNEIFVIWLQYYLTYVT